MSAGDLLEFGGDIGVIVAVLLFWRVDRRIVRIETVLERFLRHTTTESGK